MRVFRVNERFLYIANSLDEAVSLCVAGNGIDGQPSNPRELSDHELKRETVNDEDNGVSETFFKNLRRLVKSGSQPGLFVDYEYEL